MKTQLKYIELKSGYADNGPAWIGKVDFSKSGKTVYFNGHAFHGNGHGICRDIETGKLYWISGVKKNGQDRHWAGSGQIMIDRKVIAEYLSIIGVQNLDLKKYIPVDIKETDKQQFIEIENKNTESITAHEKYSDLRELSLEELKKAIEDLKREESETNANNGKKFITAKRLAAEIFLEKLIAE
jgi:hypothetical protein